MGYSQAGFTEIVGVDIVPQPNYPFTFVQGDALAPPVELGGFDLIHASPPCQAYVSLSTGTHPRLIEPVRLLLKGYASVIENVPAAPIRRDIRLCGSSFGLGVRRHRHFELSEFWAMNPPCQHHGHNIRAYYGKPGWAAWTPKGANVQKDGRKPLLRGKVEQAPEDMGIDWMTWDELREAIPPAYTRFIGEAFLAQ